ncbi:mitochondrial protein Pet127-domain-containing protein, partial [Podospora conica]
MAELGPTSQNFHERVFTSSHRLGKKASQKRPCRNSTGTSNDFDIDGKMLRLAHHTRPSLRPLFVCTSCRSHVVHRSVQHDASTPAPPPASTPASTPAPTPAPTPQPDSVSPFSPFIPSEKLARRKELRARAEARAEARAKAKPKSKKSKAADSKLELWANTLSVWKELQSSPVLFPPAGGAPIPDATEKKPAHDDGKKKKGKGHKGQGVAPSPVPSRELELIQSAFKVLEKVLGKEARDEAAILTAKPEKPARKSKAAKPSKLDAPPTDREKAAMAKLDLAEEDKPQSVLTSLASVGRKGKPETSKKPLKLTLKEKIAWKAPKEPEFKVTPVSKRKGKAVGEFTVKSFNPGALVPIPVEKEQPPVPGLTYGLDRVLFNPGVYHLQDPRSRVFNFDPYLARIMPIREFDFNALKAYITSSKDTTLINMAAEHKKKYTGSTSSMTSMLAHFHYLLSSWRKINAAVISRNFRPDSETFTKILRAPAATFLHYKDGTYAIDADKQFDTANILSMLGKSMEKLLTLPKEDFEKYRRTKSQELTDEEKYGPEAYHYTTMGDFMMRSQLDAYDPRVPGTGMFDLKTRAVVSIRMDAAGFHKGVGYEIRGRFGQWESYEREYYDMIRAAFIKYSLQVRMGRMDGIFVAYHNTERIFGFQYIPLTEMDLALHGTDNTVLGNREYKASIHMLNEILDKAIERYPKQTLRIHVETRPADPPVMYFFAKPVTPEEVEAIQGANRAKIEEFERNMMGLGDEAGAEEAVAGEEGMNEVEVMEGAVEEQDIEEPEEGAEDPEDETKLDVWEDMMDRVEETIQNEEQGITSVRDALEHALQESGLLRGSSPEDQNRYLGMLVEALISGDSGVAAEVSEQTATEETSSPSADEAETAEQTETDIQAAEDSGDEPSLRELILRLAGRLQTEPSEQPSETDVHPEEEVSSDALRLHKFESILSELVTKTQETTDQSPSDPASTASISSEPQDATASEQQPDAATAANTSPHADKLFGMVITVNNRVNGDYVARPDKLEKADKWVVEYAIEEMEPERAARIYKQCQKRRAEALSDSEHRDKAWYEMFRGDLKKYSDKGRLHRRRETEKAPHFPVHVLGEEGPLDYESVFGGEVGEVEPYRPWKGE